MWWIYFDFTTGRAPGDSRTSQYMWGYGHYFLFGPVAAIGAGLALSVEWITDHHHVALTEQGVAMVLGSAVATILLALMFIESVAERGYELREVLVSSPERSGRSVRPCSRPP